MYSNYSDYVPINQSFCPLPILSIDKYGARKLIPRECFNFQGFPEDFKLPKLSDSKLYKLAGNAVSVPVIKLIADRLVNYLID